MPIRVKSRGNETAEQMLRRFKKLCEREGITKDVKARQYYEKPSEIKRRATIRGPIRQFTMRDSGPGERGSFGGPAGGASRDRAGGPGGARRGGRPSTGPRRGGPGGASRGPSRR